MLSIEETQELLTPIFALDGRRLTPEVVALWQSLLIKEATLRDAKTVARQWLTENTGLLKPAHLNAGIKQLRSKRIPNRVKIENEIYKQRVPVELDTPFFRQQLFRRLGDGMQLDCAIEESVNAAKQITAARQGETVRYQNPLQDTMTSLADVIRGSSK